MGHTNKNNSTINEDLVNLTFHSLVFGANSTNDAITKKLPCNINIKSLKQLCKSIFNISCTIDLLSVSLRCYKHKDVPPTVLDEDSNSLSYYGLGLDGGDIYINEMKAPI